MKLRRRDKATPRTLVILSTPRSGTHLLAHELAATGKVGLAEEFFHDQLLPEFGERFGADPASLASYIDAFHSQTAATNGVASVVVFPDHVDKLASAGALASAGPAGFVELLDLLPDPHVVLLERQSIVNQTVSFNRATQSWVWTRTKGQDAPPHPGYDFESLTAHLLRLVTIREWALAAADLSSDRLVGRTTYEHLVADRGAVITLVAEGLGLELDRASGRASDRPVRAADDESRERGDALRGDIAKLTSALRWTPRDGSTESVGAATTTIADRQLAALAESVEAHRASAFRRRPLVQRSPHGGPLIDVRSALAQARNESAPTVAVLTHGIDEWALQRFYGTSNQPTQLRIVDTWADLADADMVHINSRTLGWGHVGFEAKKALIGKARAVVQALEARGVPIMWTINEPITPGTKHVALESDFRAELAAACAVIHAATPALVAHAKTLFPLDDQRVRIGGLRSGALSAAVTDVSIRAADDDSITLLLAGSLSQYSELHAVHELVAERREAQPAFSLLVVGSAADSGSVAHQIRLLESAGAVVVETELDAGSHASLVAQCDVVLAPCSPDAWFLPIQQLADELATPVVATQCPGITTAHGVDWQRAAAVVSTIERAMASPVDAAEKANPTVAYEDLLRAIAP